MEYTPASSDSIIDSDHRIFKISASAIKGPGVPSRGLLLFELAGRLHQPRAAGAVGSAFLTLPRSGEPRLRDRVQKCVKTRKSKVSGFPSPSLSRCLAAWRPKRISRVLSG